MVKVNNFFFYFYIDDDDVDDDEVFCCCCRFIFVIHTVSLKSPCDYFGIWPMPIKVRHSLSNCGIKKRTIRFMIDASIEVRKAYQQTSFSPGYAYKTKTYVTHSQYE